MNDQINIWNVIDFQDTKDNPLKFLKDQAELLSTNTNHVLEGDVVLTEAFSQETAEMVLVYQFYIYAPLMGNFRVNLFTIVQPNKPYPIYLQDKVTNTERITINDFDSFVQQINKLLQKADVQNLIKSLYTQSTTLDKKAS